MSSDRETPGSVERTSHRKPWRDRAFPRVSRAVNVMEQSLLSRKRLRFGQRRAVHGGAWAGQQASGQSGARLRERRRHGSGAPRILDRPPNRKTAKWRSYHGADGPPGEGACGRPARFAGRGVWRGSWEVRYWAGDTSMIVTSGRAPKRTGKEAPLMPRPRFT